MVHNCIQMYNVRGHGSYNNNKKTTPDTAELTSRGWSHDSDHAAWPLAIVLWSSDFNWV